MNSDFVPVALKAGLVNNPGSDEEGRLYRQIGRSKPAPQGICVANSAAQALAWALSFDDEKSLVAFLDRSQEQFRRQPDGKRPILTERYMRFPSQKLNDFEDENELAVIAQAHPAGHPCCANPPLPQGTVVARVYGRALGPEGKPLNDTTRQEHYVEDRFNVPIEIQKTLARAFVDAGTPRVRVPNEFGRLCVTYAYLGVLDVRPLANPAGGTSDLKQCEFFAERVGEGPSWRMYGQSEVTSEADRRFGKSFQHDIKLSWEGFIEMNGNRVTRLTLSAQGTERLKWREDHALVESAAPSNEVAFLPAGHRINMTCGVRYGIIAEARAEN